MSTYNTRETNYKEAHNHSDWLLNRAIERLKIFPHANVVDLMSGYGEVGSKLNDYAFKHNIPINGFLLDAYEAQLPKQHPFEMIVGDIRDPIFADESLDRTIMKLGLHELSKTDQVEALYQINRSMKSGGISIFWELGFDSKEEQDIFRKIIRKKDELSDFDDFAKTRYFLRKEEFEKIILDSGFKKVTCIYNGKFKLKPSNWLKNDFKQDSKKVNELNNYIRHLITPTLKKELRFIDSQNELSLQFNWPIYEVLK